MNAEEKAMLNGMKDGVAIRIHELEGEVSQLRESLQRAAECLQMVRDRLAVLGEPMDATPPMNYNDAISAMLFRRLKEAGAFPGHPATVVYEPVVGNEEVFHRVPTGA